MPAAGWKAVLVRTWKEAGDDNVGLLASGVAFYGFLSIVPLLGAVVLSYGLVADPSTVMANIRSLTAVMPAEAAKLIGEQLLNVVTASGGKKGFGLLLALALALYGAMKGAGAIITALNIAYEVKERRSFIRLNLVTLAITVGAVALAIVAMVSIAALGHLDTVFPTAPRDVLAIGKIASYAFMGAIGAAAAATLYRFAPDRDGADWVWLTPGSVSVTLLWLALTLGFGFYVANFGSYDATYGSLGAVVVLLTWLYLSAYILLLGAELNSELERQAAAEAPAARHDDPAYVDRRVPAAPRRSTAIAPTPGPGFARELALSRVAAKAAPAAGLEKVRLLPALLATGGLACLRRRGRLMEGAVLMAAAAGVALLQRGAPASAEDHVQ